MRICVQLIPTYIWQHQKPIAHQLKKMSPSFAFALLVMMSVCISPSPVMMMKMDGPGTEDMVTDMPS
jgi:hypothetical protein